MDSVNAFSSSDEWKSAIIPGYPIATVPVPDKATTARQQTGRSGQPMSSRDDYERCGEVSSRTSDSDHPFLRPAPVGRFLGIIRCPFHLWGKRGKSTLARTRGQPLTRIILPLLSAMLGGFEPSGSHSS